MDSVKFLGKMLKFIMVRSMIELLLTRLSQFSELDTIIVDSPEKI